MSLVTESLYRTALGEVHLGDSLKRLDDVSDGIVDLVLTSPPFPLTAPKEYGNPSYLEYVDWLLQFTAQFKRVLSKTGSLILDLRGSYMPGRPVRTLCNYEVLIRMVREQGWRLIQDIFWHNPSTMPTIYPKDAERLKNSVNTIWWMAQSDAPKTGMDRVLVPYSESMLRRLKNKEREKKEHFPSGHTMDFSKMVDHGGAVPPNCLIIPNTLNNTPYLRRCRSIDVKPHPARFPLKIPRFFIKFLTDKGDLVLDPFFGSGTTGQAAEELGRRWLGFEQVQQYLAASVLRFADYSDLVKLRNFYDALMVEGASGIRVEREQTSIADFL